MYMRRELLREITIADYPDKILVSKARRSIYYVSETSRVKGKKKIPKTYLESPKYKFDDKGVLITVATGEPKLANPKLAGNPRYWIVNFQPIWNGLIGRQTRAALVNKLKNILLPHIQKVRPIKDKNYPVKIEFFIFDTDLNVDVSNKGVVYVKVIEDLLVTEGILKDDSKEFVNDTGRIKFIQVQDESEKKMVIRIYKSDNTAV